MENPSTWGEAEHIVAECLAQDEMGGPLGMAGLSLVRRITDALRTAGLLSND